MTNYTRLNDDCCVHDEDCDDYCYCNKDGDDDYCDCDGHDSSCLNVANVNDDWSDCYYYYY